MARRKLDHFGNTGRALHRGVTAARRLAVRGTLPDGTRAAIEVRQPAGVVRATGSFRLIDAHGAPLIESTDLGVLQTAKQWASFSAAGRMRPGGEPRAFTVIVEQADPFVAGHPRTLTVQRPDQPPLSGVLK